MSQSDSGRSRRNPYYPAFDVLLAKLLAAEQALNVSEAAFRHATESPQEWLERIQDGEMVGTLADICDDRIPGYVKHIPSLRIPDQEIDCLLRAFRDFRIQSYLWAIARAFEAFREFIEAIDKELPDTADADPVKGLVSGTGTEQRGRKCFAEALRAVRRAAPQLVECENSNVRGICLSQWIRVAAAVRHAVAHNEGVLRDADYERYRKSGLEEHFPGEMEAHTGYVLKPTPEVAKKTIRTLREYGVAIYKFVSEAQGLPARLVGQDGEITTWRR